MIPNAPKDHSSPVENTVDSSLVMARLVERTEFNRNYEAEIKCRISVGQYMRIAA